ncbi:MAG: SEC-C metal-binding domain-containing protein, partial [Oscillospiraceae bacterium]
IESAQRKIEGRNFSIRKNVLQYDDVMNSQREIIYGQRSKVLSGGDVSENIHTMVTESIEANCATFLTGETSDDWNFTALLAHYNGWLANDNDFKYSKNELEELKVADVSKLLIDRAVSLLADKEKRYGPDLMRELERTILLRCVDTKWMEHIDNMEELRRGIYLRSYAQRDPVIEYRIEGFDMFDDMVDTIKEDTTHMMLTMEFVNKPIERKQVAVATSEGAGSDGTMPAKKPVKVTKVGRNDPCPCGSGKKYKKCCGAEE